MGEIASLAPLAPVLLLVMVPAMWASLALSEIEPWAAYAVLALVPALATLWVLRRARAGVRLAAVVAAVLVAALVIAVVAVAVLPLFSIPGVGISGAGVYTFTFAPYALLLAGSLLVADRRSRQRVSVLVPLWLVAGSSVLWLEPATYVFTDSLHIDAIAGTIGALILPTLALSAWLGVLAAWTWAMLWVRRASLGGGVETSEGISGT